MDILVPPLQIPPAGARVQWGLSLTRGLSNFWPMTEVDGARAIDVVQGWHAVYAAGPIVRRGVQGIPALEFAAGSANRAVAPSGRTEWSTQWSVSVWARPTAYNSNYSRVVESSAASNGFSIEFDAAAGATDRFYGAIWNVGSATTLSGGVTHALNQWYHLVLTYDGVQGRFFVNGQLVSGPTNITNTAPTFLMRIGNYNDATTNTFAGQIGPIGYWKRALSAQEVLQLAADPYAPLRSAGLAGPFGAIDMNVATATASILAPVIEADPPAASISGAVAAATADLPIPLIEVGAVNVAGAVAEAEAAASIEYVLAQRQASVAGIVAGAIAAVLVPTISALGPSVTVAGQRAMAAAAALAADIVSNNPMIDPPVAAATAEILQVVFPPMLTPSAPAGAAAGMRAPDVRALVEEGALGGGGSPAGLNFGACTIDFAIDGIVLDVQPFAIARRGPSHDIRTSPRGYALASTRNGRGWDVQWGETLATAEAVAELRDAIGTTLLHRWTWTEPDGTAMNVLATLREVETKWSQEFPGFYDPVIFRLEERQQ